MASGLTWGEEKVWRSVAKLVMESGDSLAQGQAAQSVLGLEGLSAQALEVQSVQARAPL